MSHDTSDPPHEKPIYKPKFNLVDFDFESATNIPNHSTRSPRPTTTRKKAIAEKRPKKVVQKKGFVPKTNIVEKKKSIPIKERETLSEPYNKIIDPMPANEEEVPVGMEIKEMRRTTKKGKTIEVATYSIGAKKDDKEELELMVASFDHLIEHCIIPFTEKYPEHKEYFEQYFGAKLFNE